MDLVLLHMGLERIWAVELRLVGARATMTADTVVFQTAIDRYGRIAVIVTDVSGDKT
jgi:hypothetical protein